ncbi:MAG TPA: cyclic nucleotide-binding domain-containing protein [Gammaproteobacteria bacterium]|nr:cyclic nucleotide-binding domain-containing protein [Gammaproteobacteria bacterium]
MSAIQIRSCRTCGLQGLCLPQELGAADTVRLAECMEHRDGIPLGTVLFREGEEVAGAYMVHAGTVATYRTDPAGGFRISDFWGPGSLLEGEGLDTGRHTTTAKALESLDLCLLPMAAYELLLQEVPRLDNSLLRIAGQTLNRKQATRALWRCRGGREAVHRFLLALASGYASEGPGFLEVSWLTRLVLPREELCSHLELEDAELEKAIEEESLCGRVRLEGDNLVVPDVGALAPRLS